VRGAEVERFEGVERGVMGLSRLWKCVEKRGVAVSSEWWVVSRKAKAIRNMKREMRGGSEN
jgi:hypothetical protein